jgi:hypothetical protein
MDDDHRRHLEDLLDAWIEFACRKIHTEYVQHGPLEGGDEAVRFTGVFLEGALWGAYVGGLASEQTATLTDDLGEIEEMVADRRSTLRTTLAALEETSGTEGGPDQGGSGSPLR